MSSNILILVELLLVLGAVLAFAVYELIALRKDRKRGERPPPKGE